MQHQIELPHLSMLLVEVPEDAKVYKYDKYLEVSGRGWNIIELSSKDWQLLGTTPLLEEQAAKVVEDMDYSEGMHGMEAINHCGHPVYDNGKEDDGTWSYLTHDPVESFHSLLIAYNVDTTKPWAVLYNDKK